jgi:hypothetical protein
MSLASLRPYIRARCKAVGLSEWADGFNFENIPSNIIDKSFHMEMGTASGERLNMADQEISYPVTVRIFVKGFRQPAQGIDSATALVDSLIKEVCKAGNRATQATIKNVFFDSMALTAVSQTNDNLVVASVTFRALVILNVD